MDLNDNKALKKVINGCLRNNRRHQKIIFDSLSGKMMTVCMRYSPDKDTANEILQEGFIRLYEKLHQYRLKEENSFEGWARKIFVNIAIDYFRKKQKLKESFSEEEIESPVFVEDEIIDEIDAIKTTELRTIKIEKILKEIQALPVSYRTCFNMRVFEGMQHKEIAEKLGIHIGTSKSNYHKARVKLMEKLT